ncbi:glutathione S-transferase family protein [Desulfurispirillum indicum]|uniref:glutathione S-transferase family protein n=1 Tax=Desulfurispirillum indicum TaxID=936456 RepID=UPI001CFA6799|nr:glutathione S-transferase family protein [Desulfurispirillum indicum]UCZ57678.1 glutathione S-transferase family protein [Desulfurispirillum indicum]
MQKLELISFKLCPFVQRAVIVLRHKNIDFDVTYIDLQNKPEWFLKLSPTGRTPVLKVGDEVLFESAVIVEYLDEVTPPSLHPADPLIKAQNRAWMEFMGEIQRRIHGLYTASEESLFEQHRVAILGDLARLEAVYRGGTFFNGEEFNLIDAVMAPLCLRLELLREFTGMGLLENCPRLQQWSAVLLEMEAVRLSVVPEFPGLFRGMIERMGGVMAARLTAG